jgi:hypothetical protein
MPSSGMLRRVTTVRTDVSEERIATIIIKVSRIGELGTTLAVMLLLHVGMGRALQNALSSANVLSSSNNDTDSQHLETFCRD